MTLAVGLFALDASKANNDFIAISFLPTVLFWILDGYFLYQERLFRGLYDAVRLKDEAHIDFSMKRQSSKRRLWEAVLAKTLSLFYGTLLITITYILFRGGF